MNDIVTDVRPLGFPWQTADPFLFCVHHLDRYPRGNERLGPNASLDGRRLGMDFELRDGWRMYHGSTVPGFPAHPHRGFETITIARQGFIDHSDSLGASARFGQGDVQWMTAAAGVVHSEMFPLLDREGPNTTELFQIWLNLPREDKHAEPHFEMLWSGDVPRTRVEDAEGRATDVTVVAGALWGLVPPNPPPRSWASRPDSDVAIWTLQMESGAQVELPAAQPGSNRTLYFFAGERLGVGERSVRPGNAITVRADATLTLGNGDAPGEVLVLQGRPIAEPVVQHGPFVMNAPGEIRQAILDYNATGFGGWPWPKPDPVHAAEAGRFAVYPDGRRVTP